MASLHPKHVAKGYRRKDGHIVVAIRFDEETFQQVRAQAIAAGVSFAERVRCLVEFGLIDVAELGET